MSGRRRERRCRRAALAALLGLLVCAPSTTAALAPAGASQGLAVLHDGVVWVQRGRVLFRGFRSGVQVLQSIGEAAPTLAASSGAVVLSGIPEVGWEIGHPRPTQPSRGHPSGRLTRLERGGRPTPEVSGGGCSDWEPLTSESDFTVAGNALIDAAECPARNGAPDEAPSATRQPLFLHRLSGGGWRVLGWLRGHERPLLASTGRLLLAAAQLSATRMLVTVLDLASGRRLARFAAPDGYPSFASPRRLVLSVPLPRAAVRRRARARSDTASTRPAVPARRYRVGLYSLRGRELEGLGTSASPPLSSDMHLLALERTGVLTVRSLPSGRRRALIGFDEPARTLTGLAFRWPAVAVLETESAPLAKSEISCPGGEYGPPGQPSLRIFDLARGEPFVAPPQLAALPIPCPVSGFG